MNAIEYVVTYKTGPKEVQIEDKFAESKQAECFAFDIETSGGVAIITRRLKRVPHGQDFIDSAPPGKYLFPRE